MKMTGNPVPQLGFGSTLADGSNTYLLDKLDQLSVELGFAAYTAGKKSTIDVFFITAALMVGTAGLPHVIVRFFGRVCLDVYRVVIYNRSSFGLFCQGQPY